MALSPFEKYIWLSQVRGLTPGERGVLRYLADLSNSEGVVDRVMVRTIANQIELGRRHIFRILESLQKKTFIKERKRRTGASGLYVSNGYALELAIYHPPDSKADPGARRGKLILKLALEAIEIEAHYLADIDAYYSEDRRILSVWVESYRAAKAVYDERLVIDREAKQWGDRLKFARPTQYEFLYPPSRGAAPGQLSTPEPRDRKKKTTTKR